MSDHSYRAHPSADSLVSWFIANGGWVSPDVEVVFGDSQGFHMRALRTLSSPNIVSCPLSLTLSHLNLDPKQTELLTIESDLSRCKNIIPDHILSYLLLIEQRLKGETSPWHAYIACLPDPEYMTTPLWFDEDDMAFLAGTGLAPAARERKAELTKQLEHAKKVLREQSVALGEQLDLNILLWAATIFTSRAFISTHILPQHETVPILFPVVDILNHSVTAKVEWDFQPLKLFTLRCLDGAEVQAGQELFNNYAPKQNDELLLGYGFCVENNPIEQFALKLAFPPVLQQHAQAMGLLDPGNVPFGMSNSFLSTDPSNEQHFLRAKGHPFGRYQNRVLVFRGIPPYFVHFFFIQTVMMSDVDPHLFNFERPGPRVTLQLLVKLHQALEQRCLSLPLHIGDVPSNDKQKYAKMYRDGQARIIHSVREELKGAVDRLRIPTTITEGTSAAAPMKRTVLLSLADCLNALRSFGLHDQAAHFQASMPKQSPSPLESAIWPLVLLLFVTLDLTSQFPPNSPLSTWLHDLCTKHALPALEDGIEDADTYNFIDEHCADFILVPEATVTPVEHLDDIGMALNENLAHSAIGSLFKQPTENLGVHLVMWAMKVSEQDVVPIAEGINVQWCLFVQGPDAESEEWMFEDA